MRTFKEVSAPISSMAFTPDGKYLLACGQNGSVVKVEVATGVVRELGSQPAVGYGVVCSPDGLYIASACGDMDGVSRFGAITIWDNRTGRELVSLPGIKSAVSTICFSPDGRRLAAAGRQQPPLIWDLVAFGLVPGSQDERPSQ
jgi:WD40 repeat protein